MVTLKLVPTLSGADQPDPFEQALRAGSGRSAHPAGTGLHARARRRGVRAVPAPTSGGAARTPQQRAGTPRVPQPRQAERCSARSRDTGPRPQPPGTPRARTELSGERRPLRRGPALGPAAGAASAAPAPKPRLRLTRRGRALIRSVVLLGVALVAISLTVVTRADDVTPVSSRSMVVTEHDTLWTIADEIAPGRSRNATMNEIRELNDMSDSTVRVGQRLLLPAPR